MKTHTILFSFILLVLSCGEKEVPFNSAQFSQDEIGAVKAIQERMIAIVKSNGLNTDQFNPNLDTSLIVSQLRDGKDVNELVDWSAFEQSVENTAKSVASLNRTMNDHPKVSLELKEALMNAESQEEADRVIGLIEAQYPKAVISKKPRESDDMR